MKSRSCLGLSQAHFDNNSARTISSSLSSSPELSISSLSSSVKEEILETQKKLADQHKFSLASAEARLKRKRKRDSASKAKQRKIDVQQTRTRDLLKLLCQDEEVFTVVADIDDGGELKLRRALELQEINFSVLRTLQPHSHYNRGTQREYSSKPLKHSIVKRILVLKR